MALHSTNGHMESNTSKGRPEMSWLRDLTDIIQYAILNAGRLGGAGLLMGPFNHAWYTFLDRILPGSNTATVLRKILSDQLIASPFFAFAFFAGQYDNVVLWYRLSPLKDACVGSLRRKGEGERERDRGG